MHREEYRKTVAAGNRATVTHTGSLGREAATTYTSHSGEVTTYHYDDSHRTTRWTDSDGRVSHTGAVTRHERQPAHGTAMMSLGEGRWCRITVQEAVMSCPLSAKIHLLQ